MRRPRRLATLKKQTAESEVLDALLDIRTVFEPESAIMSTLRGALGGDSAPEAVAWVALPTSHEGLLVEQVLGQRTEGLVRLNVGVGRGLTGRVFERGTVHWVERYFDATSITHEFDEIIESERVRRMAAAPLLLDDEVLGVLTIGRRDEGPFGDAMLAQVEGLAHSAALALGIAQRSRASMAAAALAERRRLSEEVHDGISALLFSIASRSELLSSRNVEASVAREVQALQKDVAEAGELVRSLLTQWHQSASIDLSAEVHQLASDFEDRSGISTVVVIMGTIPPLDASRMKSLTRFVAVALTNVERHSSALHASVTLAGMPTQITVVVTNDGPQPPAPVVPGVGLVSVEQGLDRLGGSLHIATDPDEGSFTIRAKVPL